MRKIYIAGPMTGKPAYNAPAFEGAAQIWKAAGWEPLLPFESNSVVWRRHYGRDFDPYGDKCDYGDPILAEMIAEDMAALCRANAIALLPGWGTSKGATAELLIALNLRKEVYDAVSRDRLSLIPNVQFAHVRPATPYPWCFQTDICAGKGTCPRNPNCGD